MSGPAIRSRLLTLQQDRRAARLGHDLLDSKREAILRELLQRVRRLHDLQRSVREALNDARSVLDEAVIEMGSAQVEAAVLSQPVSASLDVRPGSLVGVLMPRLHVRWPPFSPHYGTGATSARLDDAGRLFAALLPRLAELAEEAEAVRNLNTGLLKTVRRLKAIERVVIPRLEREVRDVAATLEEEERDESVRRAAWLTRAPVEPRR